MTDLDQIIKYSKNNFFNYETSSNILDRYFYWLNWKQNETILDFGVGDGKFTANGLLPKLPKDIKQLIGCDILPVRVDFAKKNYSRPNINFIQLDIQTSCLRKDFHDKFDHIFSFYVMHWVQDTRKAMENVYRMLKPDGEFFLVFFEKGMDEIFNYLANNPKWSRYAHEKYISKWYQVKDTLPLWKEILLNVGFVDFNCFREYVVFKHGTTEIAEGLYTSVNPVFKDIPKEDLEAYEKDYLEAGTKSGHLFYETCPETNQKIAKTKAEVLIIFGKKPNV